MPGLSHSKQVRDRAKSLWEEKLTLYAIAQKLKAEFGKGAPSYNAIWRWSKVWESEGNAKVIEMEVSAS